MPFKLFITPDWSKFSTSYRVNCNTFPYILHGGSYLWKEKGVIGLLNCFLLGTVISVSGWVLSHGVLNIYYKYLKNQVRAGAGTEAGTEAEGRHRGADLGNNRSFRQTRTAIVQRAEICASCGRCLRHSHRT